jgi:DNA ligase-associated metallophosphoesterase
VIRRYRPARLVALGDSFHDAEGSGRLTPTDHALLHRMLQGIAVSWVLGNHDPTPPSDVPGESVEELHEGSIVFRHQAVPRAPEAAEVSGHFHPKATLDTRAGGVTRPCFVADGRKLMLPAFGAYTGGLDACDAAVSSLFPRGARLFLLGRDRLYSLPAASIRAAAGRAANGSGGGGDRAAGAAARACPPQNAA